MATTGSQPTIENSWNPRSAYERWLDSLELPVYRGHAADLGTIELAWWPERECNAGFLYFQGMEDIHEAELAKRSLTSDIPEEAYRDPNYEWDYGDDD